MIFGKLQRLFILVTSVLSVYNTVALPSDESTTRFFTYEIKRGHYTYCPWPCPVSERL